MNILGVGPQIFIIFFLALLLFGPKKMLQYAYQAGRIMAQLRGMWEQTMKQIQAEMKEAGLDLDPNILNNKVDIASEAEKFLNNKPQTPAASTTDTASTESLTAREILTESATAEASLTPSDEKPTSTENKYDAWLPN